MTAEQATHQADLLIEMLRDDREQRQQEARRGETKAS